MQISIQHRTMKTIQQIDLVTWDGPCKFILVHNHVAIAIIMNDIKYEKIIVVFGGDSTRSFSNASDEICLECDNYNHK